MSDSMPMASDLPTGQPRAPSPEASDQTWTAYLLDQQAAACRVLGSALYATMLSAAADNVRAGGPAWRVLARHATRDTGAALGLRFMAAVHRLVLTRAAPGLAPYYPSVGGDANPQDAWPALLEVLEDQGEHVAEMTGLPCQTNEVGRCAALVAGFLTAATSSGLPLRALEIGASAGLNLRWDTYFYSDVGSDRAWGNPASPVRLQGDWDIDPGLLGAHVEVTQRLGCDPLPLDPLSAEGRLALTASVWADQPARLDRLRGAIALAEAQPATVVAAPAIDWLPGQLREPSEGVASVVYHSVVLQYLEPTERTDVIATIAAAGRRATATAPLYWLRMEPERPLRAMSVRLTRWPDGEERLLATAGAHGNPLRWHRDPGTRSN